MLGLKLFLIMLLIVFLNACSMLNTKSRLDRFLDGETYDAPAGVPQKVSGQPPQKTQQKPKAQLAAYTAEVAEQPVEDITDQPQHNNVKSFDFSHPKMGRHSKNKSLNSKVGQQAKDGSAENSSAIAIADELRCNADDNPKFAYRKRVAVLPMGLQQRMQAVDMPYIERDYAQELLQRFSRESLIPFDATSQYVPPAAGLRQLMSAEQVRTMAKSLDVQFLVVGQLLDLSFDQTNTHTIDLALGLKAWKNLARETYQRATDSYWRELHVVIELYDGPSGALIKRDMHRGGANHFVSTQQYSGLDSNRFWRSDYGQLLSNVLNQQAQLIERQVECMPMRAQVVSVNDGHIEINVGLDALLLPGDKLKLFHRAPTGQVRDSARAYRWQYFGEVTVAGVFPLRAVALLSEDLPRDIVREGDIVQAW